MVGAVSVVIIRISLAGWRLMACDATREVQYARYEI